MGRCWEFTHFCNWKLSPAGKFLRPFSEASSSHHSIFSFHKNWQLETTSCKWSYTNALSSMAKLLHIAECLPCRIYLTQLSVPFVGRQRKGRKGENTIVTDSFLDSFWILVGAWDVEGEEPEVLTGGFSAHWGCFSLMECWQEIQPASLLRPSCCAVLFCYIMYQYMPSLWSPFIDICPMHLKLTLYAIISLSPG